MLNSLISHKQVGTMHHVRLHKLHVSFTKTRLSVAEVRREALMAADRAEQHALAQSAAANTGYSSYEALMDAIRPHRAKPMHGW